jgi:ubiquinone biosynthesis protein UbiJ
MIKSLLLSNLEKTINRFISLDPFAAKNQTPLVGKVVCFTFTDLAQSFYMCFSDQQINLQSYCQGKPDLTISGTLSSFLKMASNKKNGTLPNDMDISGNAQLAQQFQHFFNGIDIDWEEHLSHFTGDTIATEAGKFLKSARSFMKKTVHSLAMDAKEFVEEEQRVIPSKHKVESFCHEVDSLRHGIARLETRLKKING